jgi:Bacterial archaeo-eukaryotic release factor family 3
MTPTMSVSSKILDGNELRFLAGHTGPWVTILLPAFHPGAQSVAAAVRLKHLLREASERLEGKGLGRMAEELLPPLAKMAAEPDMSVGGQGVAIFRSPDVLSRYQTPEIESENLVIASHFHLMPLVATAFAPQDIHVLAINKKHLRLFRYFQGKCLELPMPRSVPTSLEEAGGFDQPDHDLENRSAAGTSVGSMRGVHFGTLSDREAAGEYLLHFFRLVDNGLHGTLHDAPLVLLGVTEEVAAYRRAAKHMNFLASGSPGNTEILSLEQIAGYARQAALRHYQVQGEQALREFRELPAREHTSVIIRGILRAAVQGRVHQLLVAEGAQFTAPMEPHLDTAHLSEDEDLINAAVVETIHRGGQVFALPKHLMAETGPMAAIFRY